MTRIIFDGRSRDRRRDRRGRAAGPSRSRPARSSSPAARSTRRSCSSCRGVGDAADLARARDPGRRTTCPASASTSRTTSRSTSSTARSPSRCSPPLADWRRPWIGFQWLFFRRGPGATNHFEGGGFVRMQRRRRLPEPDVPLPAARDPLRRQRRRRGRPRLPGPRRPDVLRCARHREDHLDRPARPSRAPVQLPLDRPGSAGVGRGGPGRPADPRPAGVRAVLRRRRDCHPGPASRPTRRSSTGSRATPRRRSIRRARPGWASTARPSWTR